MGDHHRGLRTHQHTAAASRRSRWLAGARLRYNYVPVSLAFTATSGSGNTFASTSRNPASAGV
jgi:hypothetical protein